MVTSSRFEFSRGRGVVWVCDIVESARYLNDDATADSLEAFLPRLHWLAITLVTAAGGQFIKWTGDGFLAWFEIPLMRRIKDRISLILHAIQEMTMMVNITNLGVSGQEFKIRHGVTFEDDALITKISLPDGHEQLDIIGRCVVLAFRLAAVDDLYFPKIATQQRIALAGAVKKEHIAFSRWKPSSTELLKYFKGQSRGTNALYKSVKPHIRDRSLPRFLRDTHKLVERVEKSGNSAKIDDRTNFNRVVFIQMAEGPSWAHGVIEKYDEFFSKDVVQILKDAISILGSQSVRR